MSAREHERCCICDEVSNFTNAQKRILFDILCGRGYENCIVEDARTNQCRVFLSKIPDPVIVEIYEKLGLKGNGDS
jgi:hypothetical protein